MMSAQSKCALLALEDGTYFWGRSVGEAGETFGELVFNTGMTGYQEVLTDPSYRGQIVVMTYPEIGIYGINPEDVESSGVQVAGYVVQRAVRTPSNQQATQSFPDYLDEARTVAIEGVDTRALTRHLRTQGAMRGAISTEDLDPDHLVARVKESPSMVGRNLAQEAAIDEVQHYGGPEAEAHVVLIDTGRKQGMIRDLVARGVRVTTVPYTVGLASVLEMDPDGVLLSNGPGDPEPLDEAVALIRALLERRVPIAGICLGHQLLGLAVGGSTYKMRFGHRGVNHPVKDLGGGQVVITTQNHGFAVDPTSLAIPWSPLDAAFEPANPAVLEALDVPERPSGALADKDITMAERLPAEPLVGESPLGFGAITVTHLSLNDGTVEGMRLDDYPAFSVQFHPEAAPGPHDAKPFFDTFLTKMGVNRA
jgi:carbamoyl-phosphate synthase small subunit